MLSAETVSRSLPECAHKDGFSKMIIELSERVGIVEPYSSHTKLSHSGQSQSL